MEDNSHRWSELIPPHTALTFAALWDPDDGMITFSGGHLFESDVHQALSVCDLPRDAHDGQSTILTLDGLSLPFGTSGGGLGRRTRVPTVTFAFNALDDSQSMVDPFLRSMAPQRAPTQPSAHFDWSQFWFRSVGRAIYSVARAPLERGVFRPHKSNSNESDSSSSDDGFFEDAPPLTAGTYSSTPVLVHLNLVSLNLLLQKCRV